MYVEIIPSELADVVSKAMTYEANRRRAVDDSSGYKTLHDAILNVEIVGLRLLTYVVPENLFLFFGETVESLYLAFCSFASRKSILYRPGDFYGPVYNDEAHAEKECKGDQ